MVSRDTSDDRWPDSEHLQGQSSPHLSARSVALGPKQEQMELSGLEKDMLGDLSEDTHGIWEVFEFVRQHHPDLGSEEIFRLGRDLLLAWSERGWIEVSRRPLFPSPICSMGELLKKMDRMGIAALRYYEGAPSIDLTERARADIGWLRPT